MIPHQLSFPFVTTFPTEFKTEGNLTLERFIRVYGSSEGYDRFKHDPDIFPGSYDQMVSILGKRVNDYDPATDSDIERTVEGMLNLSKQAAEEYYPENFFPSLWIHGCDKVQGREERRREIYRIDALRRDGSRHAIMAKAPKILLTITIEDNPLRFHNPLFPYSSFRIKKTAETEFAGLSALALGGVPVERPLGYFAQGKEHWLFTEFTEGIPPGEALKDPRTRRAVWESDALLLAGLCKNNIKHEGFYSSAFDDKVWNGSMVLIDTDETFDMTCSFNTGTYFKDHPDKLPEYHIAWLTDCLSEYSAHAGMTLQEMHAYAKTFLGAMGYGYDKNMIIAAIKPGHITEEDHISMMMDVG